MFRNRDCIGKKNKQEIEEAKFIRESIKKSFKSKDCYCLPIPLSNGLNGMTIEQILQNLDLIDFNHLRLEFRTPVNELCETIKTNIRPKTVLKIPLSALSFSKYTEIVLKN